MINPSCLHLPLTQDEVQLCYLNASVTRSNAIQSITFNSVYLMAKFLGAP